MSNSTVPRPTIRGTYSTYEDRVQQDLVEKLGHVVELNLEQLVKLEIGGWGTLLKATCPRGVKVTTRQNAGGSTTIFMEHEDSERP